MKKEILLGIVFVFVASACTTDNFIKTGICNGRFDGSLLDYLEHPGHSYDWDSTAVMVRHAGEDVVRLFEGQDPDHPEITFFGPTNHTIRRYLLQKKLTKVSDIAPELCKRILLSHVLDGKLYRDSVPLGKRGTGGNLIEDGTMCTTLEGTVFGLFASRGVWQGVNEAGPKALTIRSSNTLREIKVASTDVEPDNCVVHSLVYGYRLEEMHRDFR